MGTSYAEAGRLRAGRDDAVAEAAVLAAKLEAAEDMLRHAMGAGDADWDGWLMAHDGLCDWYRGARAGADGAARAALDARLRDEEASREHWQRVASWHAAKVRELAEENEALREWRACYEQARAELDELYEARGLPGGVEWPRFEDGEPVRFGDAVANPMMYGPPHELEDTAWRVVLDGDGWHIVGGSSTHIVQDGEYGARVQRPHLLASDGLPIEVGQTLYGESDGKAWTVEGLDRRRPWSVRAHDALDPARHRDLKPEWLTHERPDSIERVLQDACASDWPLNDDEMRGYIGRIEKLAGKGAL